MKGKVNGAFGSSTGGICLFICYRTKQSFWPHLRKGKHPCSGQSLVLTHLKLSKHFKCCSKQGSSRGTFLIQILLIAFPVVTGLATFVMMPAVYIFLAEGEIGKLQEG